MKKTFGSDFRLCRSKDFRSLFQKGRGFRESYLKVYIQPNEKSCSRLGTIIAKKTVSLSTRRHQFKRIIRESFRLSSERLSGYDIIVMLRQPPSDAAQLWSTLESVWQKISDFRQSPQ